MNQPLIRVGISESQDGSVLGPLRRPRCCRGWRGGGVRVLGSAAAAAATEDQQDDDDEEESPRCRADHDRQVGLLLLTTGHADLLRRIKK